MATKNTSQFFLHHRYWLLFGGFGIAVLTFLVLYLTTTPKWEASGTIRIGQASLLVADRIRVQLLAPAEMAMQVMRQPSFAQEVLRAEALDFSAVQYTFRVRMLNSGHIEIKTSAPSSEQAVRYLEGIVKNLKLDHDKLFDQHLSALREELKRINTLLSANQDIQERSKAFLESEWKGTPSLSDLLLLNILTLQAQSANQLTAEKVRLNEGIAPLNTYPTDFFGKTTVSDKPVSPNKLLLAISSLFIGFFAAFAILLSYLKVRFLAVGAQN